MTWLSDTDHCQETYFSEYIPFTKEKHLLKFTLGFFFAVSAWAVTPLLHVTWVPSAHSTQVLKKDLTVTNLKPLFQWDDLGSSLKPRWYSQSISNTSWASQGHPNSTGQYLVHLLRIPWGYVYHHLWWYLPTRRSVLKLPTDFPCSQPLGRSIFSYCHLSWQVMTQSLCAWLHTQSYLNKAIKV